MGEFHDINTADARYVFGLPVLVCAITFIPWLISLPEEPLDGKNLPGLITIFIAPLIVFALTSSNQLNFKKLQICGDPESK